MCCILVCSFVWHQYVPRYINGCCCPCFEAIITLGILSNVAHRPATYMLLQAYAHIARPNNHDIACTRNAGSFTNTMADTYANFITFVQVYWMGLLILFDRLAIFTQWHRVKVGVWPLCSKRLTNSFQLARSFIHCDHACMHARTV
jgi:hypothetical protein